MPSGIRGSRRTYACLYCNNSVLWGNSKLNKFCNNTCQQNHKWVNNTVPRIETGGCREPDTLKKYLIEKFGKHCSICNLGDTWHNKDLVLQLDHIDGDSDNNYPINIRLLCPNCHSQTDNFGSKGQGNRYKKITKRNSYLRDYKSLVEPRG